MLSRKETISYGMGTLGYGLESGMVIAYLLLYATEALHIAPELIGTVILIPKILDVITDLVFMRFIDRTKTRLGTYRPWLLTGIPLSVCLVLLFWCPSFLTTELTQTLWICIIYFIAVTIFETLYWCPYATLGCVISGDEHDRMRLSAIRSVFECGTSILIPVLVLPMVNYFGSSRQNPVGWRYPAVLFALLSLIGMVVCLIGTKERVQNPQPRASQASLKTQVGIMVKNKEFRRVLLSMVLIFIAMYGYYTIANYYYIYALGHEDWVSSLSCIGLIFGMIVSGISSKFERKFGKRKLILIGIGFVLLSGPFYLFAHSYVFVMIGLLFRNAGVMLTYICTFAYVPEISDQIARENKVFAPGFIMGVSSSFQKLAGTLGAYIATLLLTVGKYDSTLEVQSPFTVNVILYGFLAIYILCFIFTFFLTRKLEN